MTRVEFIGLEDVLATMDAAPQEMRKAVRRALSTASSRTSKAIKAKTPKRWRQLVGFGVWTNRATGKSGARIGYYASKSKKGKDADRTFDWYKAYWQNYGTLSRRDKTHTFKRPVKPSHYAAAKRRKNKGGITPQNFFEKAIQGWEPTFVSAFDTALAHQKELMLK